MKLSIITINRNNAAGLQKTIDSVWNQIGLDGLEVEHIIIDGASSDGSVDVIKEYQSCIVHCQLPISLKWLSEPDNGIYNAMNKGIKIALNRSESSPHYLQFLNSGDMLADNHVIMHMFTALETNKFPDILYGNMRKVMPDGTKLKDTCGATNNVTLNMFYRGCLNHSPAYIRRGLFEEYGYYDETLQICSDWKFYMQSIVLGHANVKYTNQLVTIFDMGGISETRKDILNDERNRLLQEMIPQGILKDYDRYHFPMSQYDRLKRYHLWGIVYFVERVLFKLEKWHIL